MYIQPGLAAAADGQKEQKKEKGDSLGATDVKKKTGGSAADPHRIHVARFR